jgi:hypothetical protein
MSADQSQDDAALIRRLIDELFRRAEEGDNDKVDQIQRKLRDVIGQRTPTHSTIRPVRMP